jgi:hypothetical protein
MANITPVNPDAAGSVSVTPAAATAGGDTVVGVSQYKEVYLVVHNGGGSAITVSPTPVVPCSQNTVHAAVPVSCPAAKDTYVPVPTNCVDPVTGNAGVTYSGVTSVTVAAIAKP